MKNVVLIGMPACGKSTLGVLLAKVLMMDFVDTDLLLQKQSGKPLQQMVDELGSDGFSVVEETKEYENRVSKPFLFCEKHNRMYVGVGFIRVVPERKKGEIIGVRPAKVAARFVVPKKIFKKIKKS